MMKSSRYYISKRLAINILFYILVFLPIMIDQVTGFSQKELGLTISFSQIIKGGYTLFFILYLFAFNRTAFLLIIPFVALYLLNFFVNYVIDPGRLQFLTTDISFYSKLITFPLTFFVFQDIARRYTELYEKNFRSIHVIVFVILLLAIILSVFGFGDVNYGMSESSEAAFGYKGYFIAGNELSALYMVAYSYWLYYFYTKSSNILFTLAGIVAGIMLAGLIVTKTTLASFAIITIFLPLLLGLVKAGQYKRPVYLLVYSTRMVKIFLLLVVAVIAIALTLFGDRINENINRMQGNLDNAESFNSFLLSGRDQRFAQSWKLFTEKYSFAEKMVGTGWENPQIVIQAEYIGWGTSEVDYLDLLVSYGIIGLLLFYGYWFAILFVLIKAIIIYRNPMLVPTFFSFFLLLLNSFISGHILYSALAGFYVAIMPPLFRRGKITPLSPDAI